MNTCPICTEYFTLKSPGKVQTCCNSVICQDCLYSHIKSILEEGITGDGRKDLLCAFGCGSSLKDLDVRHSFRAKHLHLIRYMFGTFLYHLVSCAGSLHSTILDKSAIFWKLAQSAGERQDLQLYERWSLSVALAYSASTPSPTLDQQDSTTSTTVDATRQQEKASSSCKTSMGDATHVYTHVLYCPRPNCECLWLVHEPYRKKKLANDRSHNNEKRHDQAPKGFSKKLMLSYSSLFFKPVRPEKEEAMMNKNGYTTLHWMNPIDIDVFDSKHLNKKKKSKYSATAMETDGKDGRLATCPGCRHQFCGLCARPWSTIAKRSGIRVTHNGQLCSIYGQRASDDDDFLTAAEVGNAKCCPGCSMRTNRTSGCNHMSCPCGYHWCYICECRFDPRHYRCEVGNAIGGNLVGSSNCIIS